MSNILDLYRRHYEYHKICVNDDTISKYEWVSNDIMEMATYDSEVDELFAKTFIEVCQAILTGLTYDYQDIDNEHYIKYILVCQLLYKFGWISWGVSIRGAWFDGWYGPDKNDKPITEKAWYGNDEIPEVPFSNENIKALIEFVTEED